MPLKIEHIKPEFIDERGFISKLIDQDKYKIRSILYLERKAGSIGANHFHKKDSHYVYVLKGKVKRSEMKMNKKNARIETAILLPGDMILTTPMTAHVDEFLEDSVILAFSTEKRNRKNYEKDTIRVNIFSPGKK